MKKWRKDKALVLDGKEEERDNGHEEEEIKGGKAMSRAAKPNEWTRKPNEEESKT